MRCNSVFAVLFLLSLSSALHAQSTDGSVSGRVTDASRAVIVEVKIVAINTDTNLRRETTTNAAGEYYLTNLSPGSYRFELDKPR
jgi:hypothetical protein